MSPTSGAAGTPRQLGLDLPHHPALGAADFLVTASNAAAMAWLDRWPDWPGGGLAIHGPAGCGKTHLARVWQVRSGARLLTPDALARLDLPGLVQAPAPIAFDRDGQAIPERQLLHAMNLLAAAGRSLLVTGREPPARWPVSLPDLASRLAALPAVAIDPPDDALLAAVLFKLFADRQLRFEAGLVEYLVQRIERSCAAAQDIVARLDRAALSSGRRIGRGLARRILEDPQEGA